MSSFCFAEGKSVYFLFIILLFFYNFLKKFTGFVGNLENTRERKKYQGKYLVSVIERNKIERNS